MPIHFENLWEKCEKLHLDESNNEMDSQSILDELAMKINLYRSVDQKTEVPPEELKIIKSRLLGEILLTITNISLKDNIDVFEALMMAYNYHSLTK